MVFSGILVPANEIAIKLSVTASSSSAEQALSANRIFAINADQDITIKFGTAGMSAATTSDYRIPANQQTTLDLGSSLTSIRVFNQGASTANVYILLLSRT